MNPKNNNKSSKNVQKSAQGKRFVKLGAIMKAKADGSLYIKFSDDVNVEGVSVAGLTASLEQPHVKFERMLAAGKIDEEEAENKISRYQPGGDLEFIRQEITVKID
jgi:hypothetical protein